MRGEHARRPWRAGLVGRPEERAPERRLEGLARHAARAQQARRRRGRRRSSNSSPTCVAPPSSTASMRPSSSASTCAAVVGLMRPERFADGAATGRADALQQRVRERMRRHAQRNAVEAGAGEIANRSARRCRHDEGQRTRPEARRERERALVEDALPPRRVEARHMGDQRIEARPLLRGVDSRHGLGARRVGAEPVDRLGREGDEAAAPSSSAARGTASAAKRLRPARAGSLTRSIVHV